MNIPKAMMYSPGDFHQIEVKKANRWLKDVLKPVVGSRMILGSADLGWETRRATVINATTTSDRNGLRGTTHTRAPHVGRRVMPTE